MDKTEEITLEVHADSLEKAFSNSAVKLFELMLGDTKINPSITKSLMLRSKDLKSLYHSYLKKLYDCASSEALLLSQVNNVAIELINDEYLLSANATGEKIRSDHKIKTLIKQVTDKNILIKEDKNGCNLQINLVVEKKDEA